MNEGKTKWKDLIKKNRYLEAENAVLRQFGIISPEMKTCERCMIVDGMRGIITDIPVAVLLKICGLKRSTYYKARRISPDRDLFIKTMIAGEFRKSGGAYGYRRITVSLCNMGIRINHKRVYRLMKALNLKSLCRNHQSPYNSFRKEFNSGAPDLLKRNFTAEEPGLRWVTDITEFRVCGRKQYLSPIIDLYNHEIISYSVSCSPELMNIIQMVHAARPRIPDGRNTILHSDNGWQYRHERYKTVLADCGITQSMSRTGKCHDNAVAENFFSIIKTEFFYNRDSTFSSLSQFRKELSEFLWYYNNRRIKSRLGTSPVKYRVQNAAC